MKEATKAEFITRCPACGKYVSRDSGYYSFPLKTEASHVECFCKQECAEKHAKEKGNKHG